MRAPLSTQVERRRCRPGLA